MKTEWQLALEHRSTVRAYARMFSKTREEAQDLFQEGMLIARRSAELWDESRGKFTSFLIMRLKQRLPLELTKIRFQHKVPECALSSRIKFEKAKHSLLGELGRKPTKKELLDKTGLQAFQHKAAYTCTVPLDSPTFGTSGSFHEVHAYKSRCGDIESYLDAVKGLRHLAQFGERLEGVDKRVWVECVMSGGAVQQTDIADDLGVSKQAVHARARRLRARFIKWAKTAHGKDYRFH